MSRSNRLLREVKKKKEVLPPEFEKVTVCYMVRAPFIHEQGKLRGYGVGNARHENICKT